MARFHFTIGMMAILGRLYFDSSSPMPSKIAGRKGLAPTFQSWLPYWHGVWRHQQNPQEIGAAYVWMLFC